MIVIITQLYQLLSQRANEKHLHCYSTFTSLMSARNIVRAEKQIHLHTVINTDTERKHKNITGVLYLDQAASLITWLEIAEHFFQSFQYWKPPERRDFLLRSWLNRGRPLVCDTSTQNTSYDRSLSPFLSFFSSPLSSPSTVKTV